MINVDQFIRTVVAKVEGFNLAQAEQLYETYFYNARFIPIEDFYGRLDSACPYAEVVDGLRTFVARGYCRTCEDELTKSEFISVLSEMYAASPEVYSSVVTKLWT